MRRDPLNLTIIKLGYQLAARGLYETPHSSPILEDLRRLPIWYSLHKSSIRNPQALNLFTYCSNNATNHIDPSGLWLGKTVGHMLTAGGGVIAGGTGALVGGIAGTVVFTPLGPVGMILGGAFGAAIGSFFDPVYAGQLNYLEDLELEHIRRVEEREEFDRKVSELLEKATEINNLMGGPLDANSCEK